MPKKELVLSGHGSLLTYQDGNENRCLGDLMNFEGHGIFEPSHGKVDVSKEHAEAHNKALDKARIEGLDKNCKVGMVGQFYFKEGHQVKTWLGTVVSDSVTVGPRVVIFTRKHMTFRGIRAKDSDCVNFKRIR